MLCLRQRFEKCVGWPIIVDCRVRAYLPTLFCFFFIFSYRIGRNPFQNCFENNKYRFEIFYIFVRYEIFVKFYYYYYYLVIIFSRHVYQSNESNLIRLYRGKRCFNRPRSLRFSTSPSRYLRTFPIW